MRKVGDGLKLCVGIDQVYCDTSGFDSGVTPPVVLLAAVISASSLATTGSGVASWPLAAASDNRFTERVWPATM